MLQAKGIIGTHEQISGCCRKEGRGIPEFDALNDPMISPSVDHQLFLMTGADVSLAIEQQIRLSGIRAHFRESALAELARLRTQGAALDNRERYREVRRWYGRDHAQTTPKEVITLPERGLESCAA